MNLVIIIKIEEDLQISPSLVATYMCGAIPIFTRWYTISFIIDYSSGKIV